MCRAVSGKTESLFFPSSEVYSHQALFFFWQMGKWTLSLSKQLEIQRSVLPRPSPTPAGVVCLLDARTCELHNPNIHKLWVLTAPITIHNSYRCLAPLSKTIIWVFSTHKLVRFTVRDPQSRKSRRSLSLCFVHSCNTATETFLINWLNPAVIFFQQPYKYYNQSKTS